MDLVLLLAVSAGLALAVSSAARAALAAREAVVRGAESAVGTHVSELRAGLVTCPERVAVDSGPAVVNLCVSAPATSVRGAGNDRVHVTSAAVLSSSGRVLSLLALASSCRVVSGRHTFDVQVAWSGAPIRWVAARVAWQPQAPQVRIRQLEWLTGGVVLWFSNSGEPSGSLLQFSAPAVFSAAVIRMRFIPNFPRGSAVAFSLDLAPWEDAGPVGVWPVLCEVQL